VLAACATKACQSSAGKNNINKKEDKRKTSFVTHTCLDVAYPLASVNARIGRHIVSFATLMNLPATKKGKENACAYNKRLLMIKTNFKNIPINNLIQVHLLSIITILRTNGARQLLKRITGRVHIKWLLLRFTKDLWEKVWDEPAQEEIGVCYCQRATFPVFIMSKQFVVPCSLYLPITGRSRFGTRTLWSGEEEAVTIEETGATTSSDGVDVQLRRLDCNACRRGFVHDLIAAVKARYISRGTTNIETKVDEWIYAPWKDRRHTQ
jgi:hypothetical protein